MTFNRRDFFKNLLGIGAAASAGVVASNAWKPPSVQAGSGGPMRPPGALPEDDFLAACIRCQRCVDACPNHAIQSIPVAEGHRFAGTPFIKPREQACMLCSRIEGDYLRCGQVCPTGALRPIEKTLKSIRTNVRMGVAKIDFNLCYSYNNYTCGTCYRACPLNGEALKVGLYEQPSIDEEVCVGCGLCERACIRYPQAIRVEAVERPPLLPILPLPQPQPTSENKEVPA